MPTILHLSDVHRTPDEPVTNDEILHALKADLESQGSEGIPPPDVLVVSGDLTHEATQLEYVEAEELIRGLLDFLKLPVARLVLVPGNHDIHWPTCEEIFRLKKQRPAGVDGDLVIPVSEGYLCVPSEEVYQVRLANFRAFYKRLASADYPTGRKSQHTVHQFPDLHLAIAGLNSCDRNDHRRLNGHLHISSIAAAADLLSDSDGIRLAVWHHDLNWRGEAARSDFLDTDSLRQVSIRSFQLGLCGHTHRPAKHDVCTIAEGDLPVVSAGSLCAGKKERSDSVPRSYNIIELFEHRARPRSCSGGEVGTLAWDSPIQGQKWQRGLLVRGPVRPSTDAPNSSHATTRQSQPPGVSATSPNRREGAYTLRRDERQNDVKEPSSISVCLDGGSIGTR